MHGVKSARSARDARVDQSRGKYKIREPTVVLLTTWKECIEPSGVDRTNACAGDCGFNVHSDPKFDGFWCKATSGDNKIVRFSTSTGSLPLRRKRLLALAAVLRRGDTRRTALFCVRIRSASDERISNG